MKLHNIINKRCCFILPDDIDKEDIIRKTVQELYYHSNLRNENVSIDEVLHEVISRESTQTTGIGKGLAFPHARLESIKGVYVAIGISSNGLDFDSLDEEKSHLFILTLVPKSNPGVLLKIRAALIEFLTDEEVRNKIIYSSNPEILKNLIQEKDIDLNQRILAGNIMKSCSGSVSLDMTLQEAAIQFHVHASDILPIVSAENNFHGTLCCHDLFAYRLPDFFQTLHSISFLKQMDPFEKYFQADTHAKIRELPLEKNNYEISPEATLMEIIFEFTVKNKEILFVVKNHQLLGMIDRYSVIDKILLLNVENIS